MQDMYVRAGHVQNCEADPRNVVTFGASPLVLALQLLKHLL